ncbi:MAG TPA: hypothetical protein VK506_12540 [Conexibacter sp.]|nr:hypothetical protein [Conexibacter sp.]
MTLVDALQRVSEIRAQIAPLQGGAAPALAAATSAPVAASAAVAPTSFAAALAQAQAPMAAPGAQPVALPPRAAELMTPGQQTFATQLAAETGLHPQVIASWLLAEQSSGAAVSREQEGNHNWLNIGWTDSGRYGTAGAVWSDPLAAAHATAGWLKGEDTVAGYGRASAGVQSILASAGQPPESQIAALQRSGWASSGYPDLPRVYGMLSG